MIQNPGPDTELPARGRQFRRLLSQMASEKVREKIALIRGKPVQPAPAAEPQPVRRIGKNTPLALSIAAAIAFPRGGITARDLKRLIQEGKLEEEWMGGELVTRLSAIEKMRTKSRSTGQSPIGIVYVIGYAAYIKIGFTSKSAAHRIGGLGTGCPEPLQVYFEFKQRPQLFERELHRRFAEYKLSGEWFRKDPELMRLLQIIKDEEADPPATGNAPHRG